jgi:hypothetical protein
VLVDGNGDGGLLLSTTMADVAASSPSVDGGSLSTVVDGAAISSLVDDAGFSTMVCLSEAPNINYES